MGWRYAELDNGVMAEAKVFRRPSSWGINEGRISKLNLYKPLGDGWWDLFYEYDRGGAVGEVEDDMLAQVLEIWPVEVEEKT